MSFTPVPASVAWLQTADPNLVREEHFIQCMTDYIKWQRASGVPETYGFTDPAAFVEYGALQEYINVVSWWPKAPNAPRLPTLYQLIVESKFSHADIGPERSAPCMKELVDVAVADVRKWLEDNGGNPDDPNETKEERAARLNRARVAKHRALHQSEFTDDPELNNMIIAMKNAERNAAAGRKWLKGEIKAAKTDMDAAIAKAKLDRADRVQRAEQAVALAESQAAGAREAIAQYKSRN